MRKKITEKESNDFRCELMKLGRLFKCVNESWIFANKVIILHPSTEAHYLAASSDKLNIEIKYI